MVPVNCTFILTSIKYTFPLLLINNNLRVPSAFSVTVYALLIFATIISAVSGAIFGRSRDIEDGPTKSFWVAAPKVYSESQQSFYLENGDSTFSYINAIYFIEDSLNPVFGSELAEEIWITIPSDVAIWKLDYYRTRGNAKALSSIYPFADFSLDFIRFRPTL